MVQRSKKEQIHLAVDATDEEKDEYASCSTSTNPAGLLPMLLMVFPFFEDEKASVRHRGAFEYDP